VFSRESAFVVINQFDMFYHAGFKLNMNVDLQTGNSEIKL